MRDRQSVVRIHRQPVGTAGAEEGPEGPDLGQGSIRQQGPAPDRIASRNGGVEEGLVAVQGDAIGAGHIVQQAIQLAGRRQPVHAPRGIVQAGLSLVGEIEIARGIEGQVVGPLEAFGIPVAQRRIDGAGLRVQAQDAAPVVGDPQPAVGMDGDAIGPAVVLGDQLPVQRRADAEDPSVRNVGDIQVAVTVEARPFQEAIDTMAGLVGRGPGVVAGVAEAVRQPRQGTGLDHLRGCKTHVPHIGFQLYRSSGAADHAARRFSTSRSSSRPQPGPSGSLSRPPAMAGRLATSAW
ncbi:hypothetical protein BOBR111200_04610 [Bordetella bronchialis]